MAPARRRLADETTRDRFPARKYDHRGCGRARDTTRPRLLRSSRRPARQAKWALDSFSAWRCSLQRLPRLSTFGEAEPYMFRLEKSFLQMIFHSHVRLHRRAGYDLRLCGLNFKTRLAGNKHHHTMLRSLASATRETLLRQARGLATSAVIASGGSSGVQLPRKSPPRAASAWWAADRLGCTPPTSSSPRSERTRGWTS